LYKSKLVVWLKDYIYTDKNKKLLIGNVSRNVFGGQIGSVDTISTGYETCLVEFFDLVNENNDLDNEDYHNIDKTALLILFYRTSLKTM